MCSPDVTTDTDINSPNLSHSTSMNCHPSLAKVRH